MISLICTYLSLGAAAAAADDQRRARLVDQDRVDLVHDRVVQLALHVVVDAELHVVAQVVEAELVVLAVGDVAAVRVASCSSSPCWLTITPVRQAEEAVEPAHPLGVAAREVVVDGDDVHALALERVQVRGERRDQRLAFAGLHLGDACRGAGPCRRSAARRSGACRARAARPRGRPRTPRAGCRRALAPFSSRSRNSNGLAPQAGVVERLHLRLELVDRRRPCGRMRFISRSCLVPKIFFRMVLSMRAVTSKRARR